MGECGFNRKVWAGSHLRCNNGVKDFYQEISLEVWDGCGLCLGYGI